MVVMGFAHTQPVNCPLCGREWQPVGSEPTTCRECREFTKKMNDDMGPIRGDGLRYDENKIPYQCIPLHLLEGAAHVFKHVTERKENPYPMWNWARGMAWSKPYACLLRHLDKWYRGEDLDSETNLNHLHHAMCNLLMLIHYLDAYKEGDDRPVFFFKPGGPDDTPKQ